MNRAPEETRSLFRKLYGLGVSNKEMSRSVGVSTYTLFVWRREYGLPERHPGLKASPVLENGRAKTLLFCDEQGRVNEQGSRGEGF